MVVALVDFILVGVIVEQESDCLTVDENCLLNYFVRVRKLHVSFYDFLVGSWIVNACSPNCQRGSPHQRPVTLRVCIPLHGRVDGCLCLVAVLGKDPYRSAGGATYVDRDAVNPGSILLRDTLDVEEGFAGSLQFLDEQTLPLLLGKFLRVQQAPHLTHGELAVVSHLARVQVKGTATWHAHRGIHCFVREDGRIELSVRAARVSNESPNDRPMSKVFERVFGYLGGSLCLFVLSFCNSFHSILIYYRPQLFESLAQHLYTFHD